MRKGKINFLTFLLCLYYITRIAFAGTNILRLADSNEALQNAKAPSLQMIEKTKDGAQFVSFAGYALVDYVTEGGEEYSIFELPTDSKNGGDIGQPRIPFYGQSVSVPKDAQVEVIIENTEINTIPGTYNIYPVQPPVADSIGSGPAEFVIDKYAYNKDAYINENKIIDIADDVIIRGDRYLYIAYHPILYNPAKKNIKAAWKVKWRLKYSYKNSER